MPYIGNTASDRFVAPKAASVFSGDGSTTAFTLDHAVGSDEDILVSVDGVIQEPSVAYAVSSGTTLTFTAAPSSNSGNNIFVYYLFRTVGTVSHPSNNALEATSGTFTGNVIIPNAGNIGSASDTDAMSISSGGVVNFTQTPTGTVYTLLSTITASADTEIDFTGQFTSTYKNYELHGTNIHMSGDGNHIGMRYFVGGAIKSDSHYRYTRIRIYSGTSSGVTDMVIGAVEQTDTDFAIIGGESIGNATGEQTNFKITIFDPLGTDNFKMMKAEANYIDLSSDSGQIHSGGHYKNGTAALTGIRIFPNSGNIASGEFKLYGIK